MTNKIKTQQIPAVEMERKAWANINEPAADCAHNDQPTPKQIGKYLVVCRIGSGGMGDVYKGQHPQLDIPVAIKTIKKELISHTTSVERLIREAKLALKINHPNVVRVFDVDSDGVTHFIVQEYIEGENLNDYIQSRPNHVVESAYAVRIAIGIAQALIATNRHGIVHRDIKPANILLTLQGEPKLADLGIARQIPSSSSTESDITHSHSSVGSPAYMSPEQIENPKLVDVRSDIYSLGVTMYQMVTGELPFASQSMRELMRNHVDMRAIDLPIVNPQVPIALSSIIGKMMAKQADERYQTPEELIAALETIDYQQAGRVSKPPVAAESPMRDSSRLPLFIKVAVLTIIAASIIIPACHLAQGRRSLSTMPISPTPPSRAAGEKVADIRGILAQINAQLEQYETSLDYWSSSPRILAFGPIDSAGVTPSLANVGESVWNDTLFDLIQRQTGYPIVDRESLPLVLQEVGLTAHQLTDSRAQLKLRRLMPASILFTSAVKVSGEVATLFVKCIDVQTTEYSVIEQPLSTHPDIDLTRAAIAGKMRSEIRSRFPIQGRITAVQADHVEINLGRCHGLTASMKLQIHGQTDVSSIQALDHARPLARAMVSVLDTFDAEIQVDNKSVPIETGMLVTEE